MNTSGIKKLFNSETINGRANVAKATYGAFVLLYIINKFRKKNKAENGTCPNCRKNAHGASSGGQCSDASAICERPGGNKSYAADKAKDSKGHGH